MGKRISIAALWGLATWTWVSMAHVFLGIPDLGLLAGVLIAGGLTARGWLMAQGRQETADIRLVGEES